MEDHADQSGAVADGARSGGGDDEDEADAAAGKGRSIRSAAADFLLEEAKQRRKEIDDNLNRLEKDQRHGLLTTAAFWGWLATHSGDVSPPLKRIVAALPAVLMTFFLLRYCVLVPVILRAAEYVQRLERAFDLPAGCGWETHVADMRGTYRVEAWLRRSTVIYWVGLTVLNLAVGLAFVTLV